MTRSGRADRIIVLTRFPRPGSVKTRLVPPLSTDEVLRLHDRLTHRTLRSVRSLVATREAVAEVRTDAPPSAARRWIAARDVAYRGQGEGDLGDRIGRAFADAFRRGSPRVLVVGSDCPRLSGAGLRDAVRRLDVCDVVLGPAEDGGYYLIGLRAESAGRALPRVFAGVPWGGEEVCAATIGLVERAGLTCALLDRLPDVDRPGDLPDAEAALARGVVGEDARVSVVVPALDDAELLPAAVASARAAGAAEVLVVDGGSRDDTRAVAAAAGARVLDGPPCRARQMNAGAAAAAGEVLLFLHADTVLPPDACRAVVGALGHAGTVAGGFTFDVPGDGRFAGPIGAVGRARGRLGGLPWGDQCLFMARDTFADLGGFPDQPVMEDAELVRRLARLGRVVTLPQRATTSARAWDEHGLVRPTATNLAVVTGYALGLDPHRLAAWRRGIAPDAARRT